MEKWAGAMDPFDLLEEFRSCRTPAEVGTALTARTQRLGLGTYAIGSMPTEADPNPTPFTVSNWPEEWGRTYHERGFGEIDPIPKVVLMRSAPILMSEIRAGRAGFMLSDRAIEMFAAAAAIGRSHGVVVPVHGPHGYHGIVVLCGPGPDPAPEWMPILHLWGLYAHDRMLELYGASVGATNGVALTGREVEVLRAARNGLSDDEIAKALGISIRTVRFHFENARNRLGARNRAEALLQAVGQHLLGA